jgi:protein-disulfide isomerase
MKLQILSLGIVSALTLTLSACTNSESVANDSGVFFVKKAGGNPTVAAKFDGKDITVAELEKSSPEIFDARLRVYQSQKRAVEEYVRNQVLEGLAKKANLSMDEFMKKEVETAKKKVDAKKVEEFLKKNNVADISKVPDHIKDQVRGLLHVQGLVASATKSNKVEIYLERPQAPELAIKTEGEASMGPKDAKVTVFEFSDFQCPFCARGKERVTELKKIYGNKIRVVFKHFPLPMHPEARPASEASMCINEQSSDKFWKFHDGLFEKQDKMATADLKELAKKVGADMKKFEECFEGKKYAAHIEASIEEARKFGVDSTPTFFVNSQPIRGARDIAEFREIIDEALSN